MAKTCNLNSELLGGFSLQFYDVVRPLLIRQRNIDVYLLLFDLLISIVTLFDCRNPQNGNTRGASKSKRSDFSKELYPV